MILCLDVGNTHIYAGLFDNKEIKFRFRYPSDQTCTSDVLGLFFREVLNSNGYDYKRVKSICLSSVVPALGYTIVSACIKYFGIDPIEIKPGVKTGIKLDIKNPLEVGADRIANAVAATAAFPNKNLLILDFGTATTVCAVSNKSAFLGGAIMPGFKLSMEALASKASKLSAVNIIKAKEALGKCTETNIQSGLYYGQLGAVKEIMRNISESVFKEDKPVIIATGGYASLFEKEKLFDVYLPDLVLEGLRLILDKNV